MTNKDNKKNQKGFYLALALCMVAIGAAAFVTYSSFLGSKTKVSSNSTSKVVTQTENNLSNVPKEESAAKSTPKSSETSSSKPAKKAQAENNELVFPCGKNVSKPFSAENPVFSITLNDWRVHNGVDYTANKGDKVVAITSGTVKEIKDDDMLGKVVVIDHNAGFEANYCGLDENIEVKANDKVDTGQTIGTIGVVPSECLEQSHLHLEIIKDGKFVDPAKILEKAK